MILGREILHVDRVTSTMELAAAHTESGAAEGLVIVAREQTAGRGRAGRTWIAPPGASLLLSILLRPTVRADCLGALSLLAAVAVADAIELVAPSVSCALKWPNDVRIGGRKIAGILLRSRLHAAGVSFVILGIGVNVTTPVQHLEPGATSLIAEGVASVQPDDLLAPLLDSLNELYALFLDAEGTPSLDRWTDRAEMAGEEVVVDRESDIVEGRLSGVDRYGRLLVSTVDRGLITVAHGDLSRGPRPASTW
jgi:BirA family transcriptional regulator, biotin operon repressor / biotin---[acetyl-CoA-carboxylase] ligase